MSNYLKEALKELKYLYEAKADIDAFKNKFGETNYNNFLKAKDRLKNKKLSTDIIYYTKNYSKEDLEKLILSLYDDKKDSQKKRMIKGEDKQIRGKYKYFGEFGNWKVYQPLDYISSMDLGVNTGWCTTGRYGHYGKPDFTPSEKAAKTHFEEYTKEYGVKLYYFLNKSTMYGEYAIALYPKTVSREYIEVYDKNTKQVIGMSNVNYELFNAQDHNIWYESDVVKIAKEKLKLKLILDIEETKQLDSCLEIDDGVLVKCWDKTIKEIIIPNSVSILGYGVFRSCKNLTSIVIPSSVTSIDEAAFYDCSSLASVVIPSSVTSIGNSAFENCSSLTSITIPSSVTSIDEAAFYDCSSLASVVIPDSVTSIGNSAFSYCSSLTNITIPNSVTSIGYYAFSYCSSLTNITIPDSVTSIGNSAFENCSSLTNITIPNSVTSIGYYAFSYCSSLTNITIPSSVTSIGNSAFENCSSLTSITIPEGVTSIGNSAFYNCRSLTTITIPDSVVSIDSKAFYGCSSLTSMTIPNSVTSIDSYIFYCCKNLKDIYFIGTEEQWDKLMGSKDENEISSSVNIHFNSKPNKVSESRQSRRTTTRLVEAPDMFGIPTDDELDKEYQQDLDYLNKQRDSKREKTLSRRTKVQALVNDIEDWIKNNNSNLLKVVTKLLNNPNILSLNTYKWENRVAKKTGWSSLSFYFRDKSSFEINRYIKINMLDGSYKFDFKIEPYNFSSSNDPCYILTNLLEILNNLDIDSFIEEVINDNKEITNSEQNFIDKFISQSNRITSIKDCSDGSHWAHGDKFFIFTVDNKYVYHFETYDSGAYSGDHTNTLRCFNKIDRASYGSYSYDSPIIKKIDVNDTGLEIVNRWGRVNIVGGKIDLDKLISQSK